MAIFVSLVCVLPARAQDGALPAKQPGVVRIGLVKPKVQVVAADPGQVSEAVRGTLSEFLSGPSQEVVLLSSRAQVQAIEEGRLAECDYVLFSNLIQKRNGAGGSVLGSALNNVANVAASTYIPGSNPISSAVTTTVLNTAADYAATVQAQDELRFEYSVQRISGGTPVLEKKQKARADSDGQDLLTPMVEGAAEAIATAVHKAAH